MELSVLSAVFIMSFLGSWHCAAMCGPLSCNFRSKENFMSYHLGRLVSYSVIAVLLFYGTHYFLDTDSRGLKLGASVGFGILLMIFGLSQLQSLPGQKRISFKLFKGQQLLLKKYKAVLTRFPLLLGLLTGLFPCGWLYSFLILASQMKSLPAALTVVFTFWLTSLPGFMVFTGFMNQLIKSSPVSHQKISAIVLVIAGVFSIYGHWAEILFRG